MTNTTSKPENVIRIGNISAAIWKRPGKEGNGHFYSVQLQRSYRTIDGTQYTDSFNHEDLLNVAAVATQADQQAFELICTMSSFDYFLSNIF